MPVEAASTPDPAWIPAPGLSAGVTLRSYAQWISSKKS